ncbi:MAG: Dabb family protein [Vicinamibacterales bacterium]
MFVHNVFFWLKDDLSDSDRAAFVRGLDNLLSIETIERAYKGVPAETDRPVIDRSYSYGVSVVFRDKVAHDAYQTHPKHDAFRDGCAKYWQKVLIYDFTEP